MRLIDTDALVERINEIRDVEYNNGNISTAYGLELAASLVRSALTIDAEMVIRCKDCVQYRTNGYCEYHGASVLREWFCWRGEEE